MDNIQNNSDMAVKLEWMQQSIYRRFITVKVRLWALFMY